jgi:hypothetical protein
MYRIEIQYIMLQKKMIIVSHDKSLISRRVVEPALVSEPTSLAGAIKPTHFLLLLSFHSIDCSFQRRYTTWWQNVNTRGGICVAAALRLFFSG